MIFQVNHCNGHIALGALSLSWGNPVVDMDLPGFFALSWGSWALETGDIDQGRPGIYLTQYIDDQPYPVLTIWQA